MLAPNRRYNLGLRYRFAGLGLPKDTFYGFPERSQPLVRHIPKSIPPQRRVESLPEDEPARG